MANDDFARGPATIIFTIKKYKIMNQKEEMYNEDNGGGGAGHTQSSGTSENGWLKYVAFGVMFIALVVGVVFAILK